MPIFYYTAINTGSSQEVSGEIEADSSAVAARLLYAQELIVDSLDTTPLEEKESYGPVVRILASLPIVTKDRIFVYRQLGLMLRSGMTLSDSMEVIAKDYPKRDVQDILQNIISAIQSGATFSTASTEHPRLFPSLTARIISAAEQTGRLDTSMDRLAANTEYWSDVQKQVIQALIYPAIIFFFATGIGSFMFFVIIPKFESLLRGNKAELPDITKLLFTLSHFARDYWWVALLLLITSVCGLYLGWRTQKGRTILEHALLQTPVIGKVLKSAAISRFGATMSLLLSSGLSLTDAIEIVGQLMNITLFRQCFEQIHDKLYQGFTFKQCLKVPLIPHLVANVAAVGEETGMIEEVMDELSTFYTKELERTIKTIVLLIEPILMLVVGLMVSIVYIGLFSAISAMNQGF